MRLAIAAALALGTAAVPASAAPVISFEFDNLAAGVSQAVPEPATWGMMILGFGAIGAAMRRCKERSALAVAVA
ncbi:hypothetical protein FHY02_003341 [Sphingomonas sp. BK069]|nr:PEPxxWA-CTERM sorting domain-containing protein [Sphingomonas sp. BK069]MBB3348859.1 hypothetical protein [Sphingomonas sp. BK069]